MSISVSVIVPCYNASRWIRQALQSVVAQKFSNLEMIVVDDGSTDDSHDIIHREFAFVRLVRTANQGASYARNLGTSLATGKFIQYLDADDLLAAGKIRMQIDALEKSGGDVAYGDWQKLVPSGDGFVPGEVIAGMMTGEPEIELFGSFWCPPAAYLFRRSIADKVAGWNVGLPIIQDARFALDCALHGGTFVYCEGLMAYYRAHQAGSLSRRSKAAFTRDVYRNAKEVEQWWREHAGITDPRKEALAECLGYVARATYDRDPETFEAAVKDLERLYPDYAPAGPLHFRVASKLFGYRQAESLAAHYRRAKRSFALGSK